MNIYKAMQNARSHFQLKEKTDLFNKNTKYLDQIH